MKIRLVGTKEETEKAVKALQASESFRILEISDFYANRNGSLLGRVYVDTDIREFKKVNLNDILDNNICSKRDPRAGPVFYFFFAHTHIYRKQVQGAEQRRRAGGIFSVRKIRDENSDIIRAKENCRRQRGRILFTKRIADCSQHTEKRRINLFRGTK